MKLNRIKLKALSESSLQDKEMNAIVGGCDYCFCSCDYAGEPGGSTDSANMSANAQYGYHSTTGCNQMVYDRYTGDYYDESAIALAY